MKLSTLSLILIAPIMLAGCGKDDDPTQNTRDEIRVTLKEPGLMKTWELADCQDSKLLDASFREFYKFDGNDFDRVEEYYTKGNCTDPLLVLQYSGNIDLRDKVPERDDARDINFKYDKVTITPKKEEGVTLLNTLKFCGFSDWKVNTKKDITQESTQALCLVQDAPKEYFNIVKVEDERLYFGKSGSDVSSLNDRAGELDRDRAFQESDHEIIE